MPYLLMLLFGGICSYFGPWWTIAPICFIICFFLPQKTALAFWSAAFAGIPLWVGYSIYLHLSTETKLTAKVVGIFTAGFPALTDVPAIALVSVIAACIAGPISGFSGLAGAKLRQLIHPPRG